MTQTLQQAQLQYLALLGALLHDCPGGGLRFGAGLGMRAGIGPGQRFHFIRQLVGGVTAGAAQAVYETAARDGGDEHFLLTLRGIEAAGTAPDIGKDFLHGVFGIGTRARQAPGDGPDEAAELVDAFTHRLCIASRNSEKHQIGHSALSQSMSGWDRG